MWYNPLCWSKLRKVISTIKRCPVMEFQKINPETWKRKEYFDHYVSHVPCTYSITVKLDITALLKQGAKLYPAMLYAITTIVNKHKEFRTAFNEKEELGVYSQMIPCYTVFHKESETFSNTGQSTTRTMQSSLPIMRKIRKSMDAWKECPPSPIFLIITFLCPWSPGPALRALISTWKKDTVICSLFLPWADITKTKNAGCSRWLFRCTMEYVMVFMSAVL